MSNQNLPIDHENIQIIGKFPDDDLYIKNVKSGLIPSNQVFPIVYNNADKNVAIYYRSMSFYKDWVESLKTTSRCPVVPLQYLDIFLVGVRDSFILSELGKLTVDQKDLIISVIRSLEIEEGSLSSNFITISPYPTKTHSMLRYMNLSETGLELGDFDMYYAHHSKDFRYIFVDPTELSYHNFECVLNFDTILKFDPSIMANTDVQKMPVSNSNHEVDRSDHEVDRGDHEVNPSDHEVDPGDHDVNLGVNEVYPGVHLFTIDQSLNEALLKIDSWNLYTSMLASSSRGGKRLLFKSKELADILLEIVRPIMEDDVNSVNCVFRYNKFTPSDRKFTSHYDTPYRNGELVSRYTLILYLTEGDNEKDSILTIDEHRITHMPKATGVIFHQKYEHEGNPYVSSDKIFIRTELICYAEAEDYDPHNEVNQACRHFASACYFTTQATQLFELGSFTTKLFNLSTQLHFGLDPEKITIPILIKRFNNVHFATNGYDYWFCLDVDKIDATVIILLDFFNGITKNSKQRTINVKTEYDLVDVSTVYEKIRSCQFLYDNPGSDTESGGELSDGDVCDIRDVNSELSNSDGDGDFCDIRDVNGDGDEDGDGDGDEEGTHSDLSDSDHWLSRHSKKLINRLCLEGSNFKYCQSSVNYKKNMGRDWANIVNLPTLVASRLTTELEDDGIMKITDIPQTYLNYLNNLGAGLKSEYCCDYHIRHGFERKCKYNKQVYSTLCYCIKKIHKVAKSNCELDNLSASVNGIIEDIQKDLELYSLVLMDEVVYINVDDMVDTGRSITFTNTGFEKKVNFASCWNNDSTPNDYVTKPLSITKYSLPSLNYLDEPLGTRYNICYFRNTFSDTKIKDTIVLPKIIRTKIKI